MPPFSGHKFLVRETEVDIIPFGAIESDRRTIKWPSDHLMNVFGFSEALNSAVTVSLPGDLQIAVASLPAQSLLKLVAWKDRRYRDRRDAIDLRGILGAYHEGSYREQLYEECLRLLEKHDFDERLAGAERMGEEARRMIGRADRPVVADLLADDELMAQLAADMGTRPGDDRARLMAYRDRFAGAP